MIEVCGITIAIMLWIMLTASAIEKAIVMNELATQDMTQILNICDQSYIGQCWVTEYGIMSKDTCCFAQNTNLTIPYMKMGPIRDCYRIDLEKVNCMLSNFVDKNYDINKNHEINHQLIDFYLEAYRIMPNCNIFSSCSIREMMHKIHQIHQINQETTETIEIQQNLTKIFIKIKEDLTNFYQTKLDQNTGLVSNWKIMSALLFIMGTIMIFINHLKKIAFYS